MRLAIAALMVGLALPGLAAAEEIGAVDTVFKWLGPNHKIVVEAGLRARTENFQHQLNLHIKL